MAVSYGPNTYWDQLRSAIVTELTALKTNIDTNGHSPAIAAVYNSHLGTADWSFNAVSVGISAVDMEYPFEKGDPKGPIIDYIFRVDIRVMIGYENVYHDEIKVLRLCQSVVNWLSENYHPDGLANSDAFQITEPGRVTTRMDFEDTETIGGLVEFTVRARVAYTAA